jgi:hypothetical protein
MSIGDDGINMIKPLPPTIQESRNQFRWILEIRTHDDAHVPLDLGDCGHHASFHMEVTRELDNLESGVCLTNRHELLKRVVRRAILADHNFKIVLMLKFSKHCLEACNELT